MFAKHSFGGRFAAAVLRFGCLAALLSPCVVAAQPPIDPASFGLGPASGSSDATSKPSAGGGLSAGVELFGNLSLPDQDDPSSAANPDTPVVWSAEIRRTGSDRGRLSITAELGADWHLYSVTQPAGGPKPTVIKIISPGVKTVAPFQPDQPPSRSMSELYGGLMIEEHAGTVTWTAPVQ